MKSDDWNFQNLTITSRSVERLLEPLVNQVSALVSFPGNFNRSKGYSKQAETIVKTIEEMLRDYIANAEDILLNSGEHQNDYKVVLDDVKSTGKDLLKNSWNCLEDSCDVEKRKLMINSSKAMLSAVTRLMILSDIVDVYLLLKTSNNLEKCIQQMRDAKDLNLQEELWKRYEANQAILLDQVMLRQQEILDERSRLQLAAARSILLRNGPLLESSCKTYIRHPNEASAKSSRDFTLRSIVESIQMINAAVKGSGPGSTHKIYELPGEFSSAIQEFDRLAIIRPDKFSESDAKNLQSRLNQLTTDASVLSQSPLTRDEHAQGITKYCNKTAESLKQLINCYRDFNKGQHSNQDALRSAQSRLLNSTDKLRVELRRAVTDHISDTYINIAEPVSLMINAAKSGKEDRVESVAPYLADKISKLVEVANLGCSVSSNNEGIRYVRLCAHQIDKLAPEFINSCRVVALQPSSKYAQENLDRFYRETQMTLNLLSQSLDNITNIWDYLAVVDLHIGQDIDICREYDQTGNEADLTESLDVMKWRLDRLCEVVDREMEDFNATSEYRSRIQQALDQLKHQYQQRGLFKLRGSQMNEALQSIKSSVHQVWRSVVFGRDQAGYETDKDDVSDNVSDVDSTRGKPKKTSPSKVEENQILESKERAAMKVLAGQYQQEIDREIAGFLEEKKRLMHETLRWDETANELVQIARKVCQMLSEMTDFTRGRGPLQNTNEVISMASEISRAGERFNQVANQVAAQCPSSQHKVDLEKYMERVALYCHQIKITSRVKADIQNIDGELLVVSGMDRLLDSITSLIESGRNLLGSIVDALKTSYIASTKYNNNSSNRATNIIASQPVVQWRMKAPRKKPLIQPKRDDMGGNSSGRYYQEDPNYELDQFDQST